jgi:hypothetical protein
MKSFFALGLLFVFNACERSPAPATPAGPSGVDAIPAPRSASPPILTAQYDAGYRAGDLAGEAAGKEFREANRRQKPTPPTPNEEAVLALEAAGRDPERGPKWQRGYAAGYRDGFARAAEGKK